VSEITQPRTSPTKRDLRFSRSTAVEASDAVARLQARLTEESPTLATKNVLIPLVNTGGAVAQIHDS
jgi:hypothetical protein